MKMIKFILMKTPPQPIMSHACTAIDMNKQSGTLYRTLYMAEPQSILRTSFMKRSLSIRSSWDWVTAIIERCIAQMSDERLIFFQWVMMPTSDCAHRTATGHSQLVLDLWLGCDLVPSLLDTLLSSMQAANWWSHKARTADWLVNDCKPRSKTKVSHLL